MGSIVGWDPSSIQIMCKSNKQTDLGHNTISLADKNGREAEISCISVPSMDQALKRLDPSHDVTH